MFQPHSALSQSLLEGQKLSCGFGHNEAVIMLQQGMKQEPAFPSTRICYSKACCCRTLKIWRNNVEGPDSALI